MTGLTDWSDWIDWLIEIEVQKIVHSLFADDNWEWRWGKPPLHPHQNTLNNLIVWGRWGPSRKILHARGVGSECLENVARLRGRANCLKQARWQSPQKPEAETQIKHRINLGSYRKPLFSFVEGIFLSPLRRLAITGFLTSQACAKTACVLHSRAFYRTW